MVLTRLVCDKMTYEFLEFRKILSNTEGTFLKLDVGREKQIPAAFLEWVEVKDNGKWPQFVS